MAARLNVPHADVVTPAGSFGPVRVRVNGNVGRIFKNGEIVAEMNVSAVRVGETGWRVEGDAGEWSVTLSAERDCGCSGSKREPRVGGPDAVIGRSHG